MGAFESADCTHEGTNPCLRGAGEVRLSGRSLRLYGAYFNCARFFERHPQPWRCQCLGSSRAASGEWKVDARLIDDILFVYQPSMVDERIDNLSIKIDPFLACEVQRVTIIRVCISKFTNGLFITTQKSTRLVHF